MNRPQLWIITSLLFIACGDDDGTGPPPDDNDPTDPVPTAVGTPNGVPTTQSIGAGGGSVTSDDGLFSITIPPGALPSPAMSSGGEVDITIQPITNHAWGGVGPAYRLTPEGITFAEPVEISFSLEDSLLAGSDTSFVDTATQREDGTWAVLKSRRIDWENRKLIFRTSHFSDYSMTEGVQIRPASASVAVTQTQNLVIRYCTRVSVSGDPEVVSLLIQCDDGDDALVPLGTFTNWSVNAVVGGNTTLGRVAPTSGPEVLYTAPAVEPLVNPVAVSVRTVYRGMTAFLVSNITITSGTFTGTITDHGNDNGVDEPDQTVWDMTWTSEGTLGGVESFAGRGTVTYTMLDQVDCPSETMTPNSASIDTVSTFMIINHGVNPKTVTINCDADWDAEQCFQCLTDPEYCENVHWIVGFSDNLGTVSSDGNTITGYFLDLDTGRTFNYQFTRPAPPIP